MAKKRDSVHIRTLNQIGVDLENDVSSLAIPEAIVGTNDVQDVTGLTGRLKLQKISENTLNSRNWMDKQRQYLQAYEYLCHVGEAKEWIEGCLGKTIAAVVDLEESLRNGVVLAELARTFMPALVPRIFDAPKLQFRHSDNINRFFKFVDKVDVPHNFRFELTDLYEKKNVPKVIYCIHALSFVMAQAGKSRRIGDLVGKLEFTEAEIRETQRSLDANGSAMPNFKGVSSAITGVLSIHAVIVESESERVDRLLAENVADIVLLQAQARGALLRQRISYELQRLEDYETSLIELQSRARGYLVRYQYYQNAVTYRQINDWSVKLQTSSRSYLVRCAKKIRTSLYSSNGKAIVRIQAVVRGHMQRKEIEGQRKVAQQLQTNAAIIELQARARGFLCRRQQRVVQDKLASQAMMIRAVQAVARGKVIRNAYYDKVESIKKSDGAIPELQANACGKLLRLAYTEKKSAALQNTPIYNRLQAISRGHIMRRKLSLFKGVLSNEIESVVECQTLSRGLLARMKYNSVLIALTEIEWSIVELQAAARGRLQRDLYDGRIIHYNQNMEQVVKVQSFIRARQQGAAYKSLTMDKDPPISTIKNFIHLLNDSNFDFEEEVEMEQIRKQIVQSVRQNEAAEEHISEMDIKIALLVKQAIKIDEVIQHQKRLDRGTSFVAGNSNPFDLKAMTKHARHQLENYQMFFYVLQTQPVYLARLFSRVHDLGMPEKESKSIETFVMVLYGYAQKRREEYFLLKLIRTSIIKEISISNGIQDFIRAAYVWSRILTNYTKGVKDNRFLRDLLYETVEHIIQDDKLDLESDPLAIYQTITQEEELSSGQQSARPADVSQEFAIQDPKTRTMFIKHLRDLRDLTEKLLDALEAEVQKIPYGVRYIAREAYRAMEEHLVDESEDQLNRIIGNLVYHRYISPALINPEQHGILNTGISPPRRKNLAEVSKMLSQICLGKIFDEGSYLQPLNEFMLASIARMQHIFRVIVQVADAETHFGITELDDVITTKRPILYIKASDIFSIHCTIYKELEDIAPEPEDPLNIVLKALGPPPNRAEDMMLMSISNSEIALTLDPKIIDVDDPEADERTLFMQTKRYLLYIIRIQTGQSLIDILVEPVSDADERRWQETLYEEQTQRMIESRSTYGGTIQNDITSWSYAELKRECLENIVQLEHLGWVTRENRYQELLNRIADDIRSQNRRRIERQLELDSARATMQTLVEKREYLDSQLKSYNDYIEQAMMALQSKKGRKRSILPFSKQYFHMKDLQRSGTIPKFGSRKYSAAKLYQKGVLVSIMNEVPPFDRIDMTISSDQIGSFTIVSSYQGQQIPGAVHAVHLDTLLQAQYNKAETIDLFDGQVKFRVTLMLNLIFKHFFAQ